MLTDLDESAADVGDAHASAVEQAVEALLLALSGGVQPRVFDCQPGVVGKGFQPGGVIRREEPRLGAAHIEKADHFFARHDRRRGIRLNPAG